MSIRQSEEVVPLIRDLIKKLSNFQEDTEIFLYIQRHILTQIQNGDTMVFVTKREIDTSISSLSEKFHFHGFASQANELVKSYEKFVPNNTPKMQLEAKLNIMKFLLHMSDSPTSYFLEHPHSFVPVEPEEEIDWSAYLKEGIERWSPPITVSSETWTDESDSEESLKLDDNEIEETSKNLQKFAKPYNSSPQIDHYSFRKKICNSVQNTWFTKDDLYTVPESSNVDANIAIHWDEYLEYATQGLIDLKKSSKISEYKVIRELIWQLWKPHSSFCYHYIGDTLLLRDNITICSVRPLAFELFMKEFFPYIHTLQSFRDFHDSIMNESSVFKAPGTYSSYDYSVSEIVKPVFEELIKLEAEVQSQNTTMTLLQVAHKLRDIFKNVLTLKRIHDNVVLDFTTTTPVTCTIALLSRLNDGLLHCVTKTEQDIYLTLYLDSLFKYFSIINSWLNTDNLKDSFDEFIIVNCNVEEAQQHTNKKKENEHICFHDEMSDSEDEFVDWNMHFIVRDLDDFAETNSVLKIISTDVLQIGKNIHLLGLLKKLHLLHQSSTETLHDDLVNRVLKKISNFFHHKYNVDNETSSDAQISYKFPAICVDYCKYPTEMDRLENLVDVSDGFLMNAFGNFFVEKHPEQTQRDKTLFERISEMTRCIFPVKQIIDDVFVEILRERYNSSGYVVKNLLIEGYKIERHFELVKHIFLFKDDLIFPWYRRLFQQMERGTLFDNDIWLTTHLQDVIMDIHPELYERCSIKASDMWSFYKDPLKACGLVTVEYLIEWPVSLIIREKHITMYKSLFQFILKIKWALYTLNHMYFNEIAPNTQVSNQHDAVTLFLRRLKVYRFCLLNEFSAIQHYIMGYLYGKTSMKFERDFEKTCNLDTLVASHSNFIETIYSACIYFRDYNQSSYGFNYLLYLVTKLRLMWNDLRSIDDRELLKFEKSLKLCHNNLEPIMYPEDQNVSILE